MRVARTVDQALSLARIFSWDGTEAIELYRFYADAWAFVHYGLQSEVLGGPNRVDAFRSFVDRVGRGESWKPALEAAFGASLPAVEDEFRRHRRRLLEAEVNTVLHLKVSIPTKKPVFEAVPGPEIARRLAGLTSQVGESALGTRRRLYDFLLELNADDSEAQLGRMRVAVLDHDFEFAERLWSRVPLESRGDLDALLAQAELAQARWLAVAAKRRDRKHFVEARDAWGRVLAVAPEHLPALVALGMLHVELDAEDPRIGVDALRRAIDLDPQRRSIRLDLARLLVRAGEFDAARRELEPLAAAKENLETAREARRLLRQLR
jgi:Tetratricopeptide repeat